MSSSAADRCRTPGHRGRSALAVRGACRIQYWALTTLQKLRVRPRPAPAESRPRGPHDRATSREQAHTENLLILVRSLIVEAPGARENRGVKSAQSNGGLADDYRCLRQHH